VIGIMPGAVASLPSPESTEGDGWWGGQGGKPGIEGGVLPMV